MNTYELTIVIPGSASPQKKKAAGETVEKLVKVNKGSIKETKDWGKIDLAFPIKKNDTGLFTLYKLEMEADGAMAMNNRLRAEDEFIRYLLIKKINSKSEALNTKQIKNSKS
jgi:ribosomal protein S6